MVFSVISGWLVKEGLFGDERLSIPFVLHFLKTELLLWVMTSNVKNVYMIFFAISDWLATEGLFVNNFTLSWNKLALNQYVFLNSSMLYPNEYLIYTFEVIYSLDVLVVPFIEDWWTSWSTGSNWSVSTAFFVCNMISQWKGIHEF